MSNSYFRFKQFTIVQENCAMKTSTDACIFGAWIAERITGHDRVLDIGSGTGLLMMMLAQKSTAIIHGIELNVSCFHQLEQNVSQNNWKHRLRAYQGDIRTFSFDHKYDFIITNPPFYENDLPSNKTENNVAKHSHELTLNELITAIDNNLTKDGAFGILLPFARWDYFDALAVRQNFFLQEKLFIKHSPVHNFSRAILLYNRHKSEKPLSFEMSIYSHEDGGYTPAFVDLLKDYYLYL